MAVYTQIPDTELKQYLTRYSIGELHSLKGIAEGVENSNYLLTTDAGMFILTLYEKRVDPLDLPFFLGLMQHLAKNGVDCPQPVVMNDGQNLSSLASRPSAIITYLDGNSVRRPNATHCTQVGEALAKMHIAGEGFELTRENALTVKDWRPLFVLSEKNADTVATGLSEFIAKELDFLEKNWSADLPFGVIHADLFPDNVFFLKDRLSGLIDFYFACNDVLAYDVAVCINAWCFEPDNAFNVTKARALIKGYQKIRPLSDDERKALPTLCRGAALRFLLTRLFDWLNVPPGALVVPKDPSEYISKLRFHQTVATVKDYGVDAF
ncbi:MAG: homoserine kinase [Pseudomonadota bacterium]